MQSVLFRCYFAPFSRLLADIETIQTGEHPGHSLLYEFHANQSGDPDQVLMHCLGHWRLTPAFHDLPFLPRHERILTIHTQFPPCPV